MNASLEIALRKGRPEKPAAKCWDNSRVARRIKGGTIMVRSTMRLPGENFSPTNNFTPVFSEQEAASEFSAVILDFSAGQLARASGRSKDTAKCWKSGRAFPNGVSLMALVNEFPKVRRWFESKTGGINTARGMSEMFAYLEQVMSSDTAEGRAMRARALELAKGGTDV